MKNLKNLSALLLVIVIVSLFVACGNETVDSATDKLENKIENKADSIEDKIENSVENAFSNNKGSSSSGKNDLKDNQNVITPDSAAITAAQAEQIALEHAQLAAVEVVMDRTEYEIDNKIPHYEIEFHKDRKEYNYDIHAETGEILSFEIDD